MNLGLKIGFGVSLVLNVFLVGIGIGVIVTGARLAPAQAPHRPVPNIWAASDALPQQDRLAFRAMLRQQALAVQPELKSVRLARREAGALIAQPNYDPAAVSAALQRAREGEMHARGEIDQAFVDYLSRFTPQQRAAFSEVMVRARPGNLRNEAPDSKPTPPAP